MDVVVDRADSLTTTGATDTVAPHRRKATRPSGPPSEPAGGPGPTAETIPVAAPADRQPPRRGRRRLLRRIPRPKLARLRPGRKGIRFAAAAIAVVALVTATTVAALALRDHRRADAADAHRAAVVDTARRGITALINIRRDSADADFARLGDLTTAPFADELHDQSANYLQAIRDSDVLSTGEVVAAGPATDDGTGVPVPGDGTGAPAPDDGTGAPAPGDGTTTVLVAADAQVTNTQNRQQEKRSYRFTVKIKEVDGALKVSEVEFVP